MSIKYVSELSSDGTPKLVPIANGVPEAGGQLVPSVSHYQSGTKAVSAITAWGYERIDVTLPTAMPDTDYEVTTSFASQVSNITYLGVNITDKTTTGFRAYVRNFGENGVAACTLQWQAFKLITDTSYTAMQTAVDEALPPLSALDTSSSKAVSSQAVQNALAPVAGLTVKGISYTYQSATTLAGIIKEILDNQMNPATTDTGTYMGSIKSTHSGGGDTGSWVGYYSLFVVRNGAYQGHGTVICQGKQFLVHVQSPVSNGWTVHQTYPTA